jgi:hypothetical protein
MAKTQGRMKNNIVIDKKEYGKCSRNISYGDKTIIRFNKVLMHPSRFGF